MGTVSESMVSQLGGTQCEATDWVSDSILVCVPASGCMSSRSVIVTVSSGLGTVSDVVSFDGVLGT
eukprot:3824654-Rhodomonas_salina.1